MGVIQPSSIGRILSHISLFSFVLVQWGIYSFFFPKRIKEQMYFIGACGAAVIVISIGMFVGHEASSALTDVFFLVLIGLALIWLYPQYRRNFKYLMALIVLSISVVCQLFYTLTDSLVLVSLGILMSAAHYFILFLLLFERVIEVIFAIRQTSRLDGLTGLYQKKYFIDKTQEAIHNQEAVALIFCDIDNFKSLNDTHGHQVGDQALKFVAKVFKEVVGESGIVGRYGGEEMVALILDQDADPADLAESFRVRIEEESLESIGETAVTVSVGYSRYGADVASAAEFIKQADQAMYKAKQRGKNRVVSYQVVDV
jgi:diguanylate cyclase (GGDEF)-like protein